jgi:hypothetical protein
MSQTSLVRQLVMATNASASNFFLGLLVYQATNANNSNFFGQVLVLVQQLLKIQISLVRC